MTKEVEAAAKKIVYPGPLHEHVEKIMAAKYYRPAHLISSDDTTFKMSLEAGSEAFTVPKTVDGHDFQGVYVRQDGTMFTVRNMRCDRHSKYFYRLQAHEAVVVDTRLVEEPHPEAKFTMEFHQQLNPPTAVIHHRMTERSNRRGGIGTVMFTRIEELASSLGAEKMSVPIVLADEQEADLLIPFLERRGYARRDEADCIHMDKAITPQRQPGDLHILHCIPCDPSNPKMRHVEPITTPKH